MKAGASGNLKSGGLSKRLASGATGPGGGSTAGGASKSRATGSNESGSNNAGRFNVLCEGKLVTPKDLRPTNPQKDGKADGTDEFADGKLAAGEGGPGPIPPPEGKLKREKPPSLGKEELERPVDIILAETETVTLMSFPSICVSVELQSSAMVSARIKAYEELCASKADSDQYREQHAQTLNHDKKSKEVLAAPPLQEHVEVSANGWDIWDTFASDPVPKHEQIQQACDKESAATVALAVKKPGCLFDMTEPIMNPDMKDSPKAKKGTGGKSGPVSKMGVSLGGGVSKNLSPGQSGSLAAPASVAASQPIADAEEDAAAVVPAEGAEAPDATAEKPVEEEKPPADPIPWKLGSGTPIPEELSGALRVMERIVSQNVFHKQHMIYRNYPTLEELRLLELKNEDLSGMDAMDIVGAGRQSMQDTGSADGGEGYTGEDGADGYPEESETHLKPDSGKASDRPSLQDLFCFEAAQLTQGMTVTCAEWNRHNQDLLAVSYGDTVPVPADDSGGLVLFWSLKNPTYPERVIRTRDGVTALHFSSAHPNMVAAGTHDGAVMIWDLRRPSDQPVVKSGSSISQHNDQKHTDIVWETRWVDRGQGMVPPETLVSVSSDGKVFQWSMKKGLEQSCLMTLKRIPNIHLGSNSVYGHKEGIVSRKSSGFCIDFPRHDPSTYLVGTEDGLVHRCSTSSNEQYLDTYYGHSGPVYKVRCNPFMSHAFLTCSADWTMRLWTTKPPPGHPGDTPLLEFKSTDLCDAVNDVIWAPQNSTSFAAAMDDGRVELWDLSEKPLDPIVTHYPKGFEHRRRRTTVRFSPNSPVLIAGDDRGSVEVMRMYNTNQNYYSDQEQQDRLNSVMVKKR